MGKLAGLASHPSPFTASSPASKDIRISEKGGSDVGVSQRRRFLFFFPSLLTLIFQGLRCASESDYLERNQNLKLSSRLHGTGTRESITLRRLLPC